MRWFRKWQERRKQRRASLQVDDVFEEIFGVPNIAHVRKWSRDKLHEQLAANKLDKAQRIAAESELKRREAWDAPAGRAYWISIAAIILAAVSLALNFWKL